MNPTPTPPQDASESSTGLRADRAALWRRYQRAKAGSAIEEELVEQYLPLVKSAVGRIAMTLPSHVDLEDLNSAGLVGLLNAVRNYNPESPASFETYARFRIRGSIFDELRRMDWVPRSVHDKARKVQRAMQEVEQAKGRIPSEVEMAKALNISVPEYQTWLLDIRPATYVCLDAQLNSEDDFGSSLYESVADQSQENPVDGVSRKELAMLIAQRLEQLPEMQRKVLALYYFEDLRLREIAEVFGVTESRISQIHAQAVLSIKSFLQKYDACPA